MTPAIITFALLALAAIAHVDIATTMQLDAQRKARNIAMTWLRLRLVYRYRNALRSMESARPTPVPDFRYMAQRITTVVTVRSAIDRVAQHSESAAQTLSSAASDFMRGIE